VTAADQAVALLRDGYSPRQAAEKTGLSQEQIAEAVRRHRMTPAVRAVPDDSVEQLLKVAAGVHDPVIRAAHRRAVASLAKLREELDAGKGRRLAAEQLEAAEKALEEAKEAFRAAGGKRTYKPRGQVAS
jgi:bacterioferritin-associated ferredoxin